MDTKITSTTKKTPAVIYTVIILIIVAGIWYAYAASSSISNSATGASTAAELKANRNEMITLFTAKDAALAELDIDEDDVTFNSSAMDKLYEGLSARIIYRVNLTHEDTEYEFLIDAYTEEVISYESEEV